jgi:hypothetical protein
MAKATTNAATIRASVPPLIEPFRLSCMQYSRQITGKRRSLRDGSGIIAGSVHSLVTAHRTPSRPEDVPCRPFGAYCNDWPPDMTGPAATLPSSVTPRKE